MPKPMTLQDVCGRYTDGIHCALSTNGNELGWSTQWTEQYSDSDGWNNHPKYWSTIQFADVNDDGGDDVCGRGTGGLICGLGSAYRNEFQHLSNTPWNAPAFSDAGGWGEEKYYGTLSLVDVNGTAWQTTAGAASTASIAHTTYHWIGRSTLPGIGRSTLPERCFVRGISVM